MKIESMNLNRELRAQLGLRKQLSDRPAVQLRSNLPENENKSEARYYEKEFKKFHIKLAVIISIIVAGMLTLIFHLPGLIDRFYSSVKT